MFVLVILGLVFQLAIVALAVSLGTEKIRKEVTAIREALTSSTPTP
jgi:hypothetical protein